MRATDCQRATCSFRAPHSARNYISSTRPVWQFSERCTAEGILSAIDYNAETHVVDATAWAELGTHIEVAQLVR